MMRWLVAFLFTQVVEVPIYYPRLPGRSRPGRIGLAFVASLITHPVVWFAFPRLIPGSYFLTVVAAETFAIAVEALYLARLGVRQALAVSMVANGASAGLGFLSRALIGWP